MATFIPPIPSGKVRAARGKVNDIIAAISGTAEWLVKFAASANEAVTIQPKVVPASTDDKALVLKDTAGAVKASLTFGGKLSVGDVVATGVVTFPNNAVPPTVVDADTVEAQTADVLDPVTSTLTNNLNRLRSRVVAVLGTASWLDAVPITLQAVLGLLNVTTGHSHNGTTANHGPKLTAAAFAAGAVGTAALADLGVTTGKLADGSVTSIKIADGTIATGDLAAGACTGATLGADVVTLSAVQTLSSKTLTSPTLSTGAAGTAITNANLSTTPGAGLLAGGTHTHDSGGDVLYVPAAWARGTNGIFNGSSPTYPAGSLLSTPTSASWTEWTVFANSGTYTFAGLWNRGTNNAPTALTLSFKLDGVTQMTVSVSGSSPANDTNTSASGIVLAAGRHTLRIELAASPDNSYTYGALVTGLVLSRTGA